MLGKRLLEMKYETLPPVVFENVGVCFERSATRFLNFKRAAKTDKRFWALRGVSFTLCEGETLGVIGRNGSGKSTLSMLCSRVLHADSGRVMINGRAQLLALGVGFKKELTGRENVFISGSLLGLSKKEIQGRMDEIEEFAELNDFMDEPVRIYSSGMRSRLGFAIATAIRPDILILDEIMATGDKAFQDKAMERMMNLHNLARSAIIISHSPPQLKKLCNKVIWLEKGKVVMQGDPKLVLSAYNEFCRNPGEWISEHPEYFKSSGKQ
jgi:ABC-type polysaccharide/polyol phosphate transport system ATPase subunit